MMTDQPQGLNPQRTKEEEGNTDILYQILVELKRINSQLILITDTIVREEDILIEKEEIP